MRTPTAVVEGADTTILVAIEDLVAGLPRDPELGAQRRHLLALKQAGDKPEPLVHDVTLLPRHAPSCDGAEVSRMCPEYGVTYLSGRTSAERQPDEPVHGHRQEMDTRGLRPVVQEECGNDG